MLSGFAQLVQIKRGADLPSSVGERMNSSLLRMQAFLAEIGIPAAKRPAMCCLLTVGLYLPYDDGLVGDADTLYIGEARSNRTGKGPYVYTEEYTHTHTGYHAVESALNGWVARGGSVLATCPSLAMLPSYLDRQEKRLSDYAATPIKVITPTKPAVGQVEYEIAPGLQVLQDPPKLYKWLACQPGIGAGLAQGVIDYFITNCVANQLPSGLDGLDILLHLTSPVGPHPPRWGKGKAKALAEYLCISWDKRSIEQLESETTTT